MPKGKKSYNLQNTTRSELLKNTKQYLQWTAYKDLFTTHTKENKEKTEKVL